MFRYMTLELLHVIRDVEHIKWV